MTTARDLRKGWCPGALRPMRSGDGLLVRVRARAGMFSIAALRTIADIAARFGSGEIDLTNRGNLQLRGVSDDGFGDVLAVLGDAGLLDTSSEAEAVRNVMVDPLSGIDPTRKNVGDLAESLENDIVAQPFFWALPAKFGFSFSGAAESKVAGRTADIMVSADEDRYLLALDGAAGVCSVVPRDAVVEAMQRLALAFLELRENDHSLRRMRDAVERLGAVKVLAMAGLTMSRRASHSTAQSPAVGMLRHDERVFGAGIGLPFGRITAGQLQAICAAVRLDADAVRVSPRRVLIFPTPSAADAELLLRAAEAQGLIVGSDVRLMMDVCPGSGACRNATTDTRGDAQRFSKSFSGSLNGYSIHVSGCEKGCARRAKASFTLVGRDGCYDVIKDGTPSSTDIYTVIEPDDVAAALARLIMEPAA